MYMAYCVYSADWFAEWRRLWWDQRTTLLCAVSGLSALPRRPPVQVRPMYVDTRLSVCLSDASQ